MLDTRIENLAEKKLIGKHMSMTFARNRTQELWKSFMHRRQEIKNKVNTDLISMQIYPLSFDFAHFNPDVLFEKWACLEVTDYNVIPEEMDTYTLPDGLYAVFIYQGVPSEGEKTFRYIFEKWLPDSEYKIDHRPHFEILGEKYKHEDPASEEEIWIPIKLK